MTDTTLNRFISSGTHAQRLAFTPVQATPGSGPSPSAIWFETDTGDTYMWNFGGSVWTKIDIAAGGGGAGSNYKGIQPFSMHNGTGTSGFWVGTQVLMDESCTLNSVMMAATAAAPTATLQGAIYSDTGSGAGTLLASSGVVTGVVAGINTRTLSSPLAVTQGTFYWIGMVIEVVTVNIATSGTQNEGHFATAGPAPATATALTFGTFAGSAMWASK